MLFCGPGNVPARGRPRTGEQARCSQRWCSEGGGGSATRWRGGGRRVRRSVGAQLRDCSGANDLIGPPSALSICRTHTPPAIARVLCAAISATPDNTRPLPHPTTGVVVELEGAVGKPKVPLRVPHRDQFYFFRTESRPHWTTSGRTSGESSSFCKQQARRHYFQQRHATACSKLRLLLPSGLPIWLRGPRR